MSKLELKPQDLAKIQAYRRPEQDSSRLDDESIMIAEFAYFYGWAAYEAFKRDEITTDELATFVKVAKRIENRQHYLNSQANFIGAASARAKNPSSAFNSATKKILNELKRR